MTPIQLFLQQLANPALRGTPQRVYRPVPSVVQDRVQGREPYVVHGGQTRE